VPFTWVGRPKKGFELRAVHQFKTLVGHSLLTVGTLNAQPTFGKLWSVWPQFVVKKTVGPRLYFAVRKIFAAIPTTQDPVGHRFSLGTGRHCYGTECSSSGIAFTYPQVGTSGGTNRVAKTRQSGAMTRYAYTDSVESLSIQRRQNIISYVPLKLFLGSEMRLADRATPPPIFPPREPALDICPGIAAVIRPPILPSSMYLPVRRACSWALWRAAANTACCFGDLVFWISLIELGIRDYRL